MMAHGGCCDDAGGWAADGAAPGRNWLIVGLLVVLMLMLFVVGYQMTVSPFSARASGSVTKIVAHTKTAGADGSAVYSATVVVAYSFKEKVYHAQVDVEGSKPWAEGDRVELNVDPSDPTLVLVKKPPGWAGPACIFAGVVVGLVTWMC